MTCYDVLLDIFLDRGYIGSCVSTLRLDMQVTLHIEIIVMQVTLHYDIIVMQVTLHDKKIVMQVTLHYNSDASYVA